MLGNTYHLENRPGSGRVARLGGLQEFTGWRRPMLTDSGGFQVGRSHTQSGVTAVNGAEPGSQRPAARCGFLRVLLGGIWTLRVSSLYAWQGLTMDWWSVGSWLRDPCIQDWTPPVHRMILSAASIDCTRQGGGLSALQRVHRADTVRGGRCLCVLVPTHGPRSVCWCFATSSSPLRRWCRCCTWRRSRRRGSPSRRRATAACCSLPSSPSPSRTGWVRWCSACLARCMIAAALSVCPYVSLFDVCALDSPLWGACRASSRVLHPRFSQIWHPSREISVAGKQNKRSPMHHQHASTQVSCGWRRLQGPRNAILLPQARTS